MGLHVQNAVSKRISKIQVLVTAASIGAFSLLLLGAVIGYRAHRKHKLKDVFVDVAGMYFVVILSEKAYSTIVVESEFFVQGALTSG